MAAVLPGRFAFLATAHTASIATTRALAFLPGVAVSAIHELKVLDPPLTFSPDSREYHWTYAQLKDKYPDLFPGGELVFTTVRHPCDLIVTWWLRLGQERPFEEFVRTYNKDGSYLHDGRMFWNDATRFLRYENLQAELNDLLEEFGVGPVELEPCNVTENKRPWQSYYTDEIVDVVRHRFGDEAAAHGYDLCL